MQAIFFISKCGQKTKWSDLPWFRTTRICTRPDIRSRRRFSCNCGISNCLVNCPLASGASVLPWINLCLAGTSRFPCNPVPRNLGSPSASCIRILGKKKHPLISVQTLQRKKIPIFIILGFEKVSIFTWKIGIFRKNVS